METFLNLGILAGATVFLWLVVLTVVVIQAVSHYRKLTEGTTKEDLKSILEKLLKKMEVGEEETGELVEKVADLRKDAAFHIQKVGLVRFNPFDETGGDQSFTLALLDANQNGVVISSLYRREETRVYAKPVKNGKGVDYGLSEEEKEAIKKAGGKSKSQ